VLILDFVVESLPMDSQVVLRAMLLLIIRITNHVDAATLLAVLSFETLTSILSSNMSMAAEHGRRDLR
jgi:hypothetical protein